MIVKERLTEKEIYLFDLCRGIKKYKSIYNREIVKVAEYYLKFQEYLIKDHPEDAITNGRRACEAICTHLYNSNGLKKNKETLNDSVNILFKAGIIDKRILDRFTSTRLWGNMGTHYQENEIEQVTYDDAEWAFEGLKYIVKWYYDKFNITLEDIKWLGICDINTIEGYESYIENEDNNKYKKEALKRVEKLNDIKQKEIDKKSKVDINAWNKACKKDNITSYKSYLSLNISNKKYEKQAIDRIDQLKEIEDNNKMENEEWKKAISENSIESYNRYINLKINKRHYDEAISKIKTLENNKVKEKEIWELYSTEELYRQAKLQYVQSKNHNDYNKVYKIAWVSANKGHSESQLLLGKIYYFGRGIKQDYQNAFFWFNEASKSDNREAMLNCGHMYYNGKGIERNYKKAFEIYEKLAELEEFNAAKLVARMYLKGQGVIQDNYKAARYFEQAAMKNDIEAKVIVADFYKSGNGIKKNLRSAFNWYEEAARQGNLEAIFNIAIMLYYGDGCKKNHKKSFDIIEANINKYSDEVQKNKLEIILANIYYKGIDVERDYEKAFNIYNKLSELGVAEAISKLADMYYEGKYVDKDYKRAFNLYKISIDKGCECDIKKLANMYLYGLGTIENHKYAYVWYKRLAFKGDTLGMRMLGYAYLNGDTVDINYNEAFYWYSEAVKNGDYESCIPLAFIYENGLGIEKNKSMSEKLLKMTVN